MSDSRSKEHVDWSEDRWKEMLVKQRKFLWKPEAIARYADWMGLRQGMTAVDVGCGLGFLGSTYWPYFGKGGRYIGIDKSEKLLQDATAGAKLWSRGGEVEFVEGDAYNLPLPDEHVDWVMCQTLLMHLEYPEKALREMIRILKPGGLIMCKEPDNLSGILARNYLSIGECSIEEYLLEAKVHMIMYDGRKKLGRGDFAIGNRVPHLLAGLGMTEIDIRMKEACFFLEPPYESEEQQHKLKQLRKHFTEDRKDDYWKIRSREEFLAGGGDIEDFDKHYEFMEGYLKRAVEQIDAGQFSASGGYFFYIVKARKQPSTQI